MTSATLVIGFGNSLRTDDGVGRLAAERLAADPRLAGATVIGCHQLTPELALDVSRADLVVFVDASADASPGELTIEPVSRRLTDQAHTSHHLGPSTLVALAAELFGRSPRALQASVGVASTEVGQGLSPRIAAAMPQLVDAIAEIVAEADRA